MTTITWGHAALRVELSAPADGPLTVVRWGDPAVPDRVRPPAPYPAVEVLTAAGGRARASQRLVDTAVGRDLRVVDHTTSLDAGLHRLTVRLASPTLEVTWQLTSYDGVPAASATTTVRNTSAAPITLLAATSLTCPAAAALPTGDVDALSLLRADSDWLGENRWQRVPLRDLLADIALTVHDQDPRGSHAVISKGTWSTGNVLPVGGLVHADGPTMLWQVEHNGPWRWEVGETRAGAYVATSGPEDLDHQAAVVVAPGATYVGVPATLATGPDLEATVAAMTAHRRAAWHPHPDREARPVVFNDYMNTVMGDPTTERLLPLIDAAAAVGAECFVIDAGWYADDSDWWDGVGEWLPAPTRFPNGLVEVLDRIREHGMVPGLWLEPEVVGVRSPMGDRLPAEAFFSRHGERLVEHDRFHLDLRHPAARAHIDATVDRLVTELGVGYFKLDYNIDPGPGTDREAPSPGAGLLGHNRAQLDWISSVLERHPHLVLENCGSGGMRADPATLARFPLQSTSDQQDPLRYPPIAVGAPLSMPPEQAASWAYPQPDMPDEEIAFTLATTMLGRFYLSGNLDRMSEPQRRLVVEAVDAHRAIRADIARSVPCWPLGLPGWDDPWLALGLRPADDPAGPVLVTLWRRDGVEFGHDVPAETEISLPGLLGREVEVDAVFPTSLPAWRTTWDPARAVLRVKGGPGTGARTLRVRPVTAR